jgi:DNA end-binding protein Ku
MRQRGKWALGGVTLSGNRKLVLVRPAGHLLAMDVLHYPAEVRSRAVLEVGLSTGMASEEELKLAALLIDAASGPVQWQQYRDDTADKIRALVEAKIAGRTPQLPEEEPVQMLQLLDALKQSVAATTGPKEAALAKPATSRKPSRRRSA